MNSLSKMDPLRLFFVLLLLLKFHSNVKAQTNVMDSIEGKLKQIEKSRKTDDTACTRLNLLIALCENCDPPEILTYAKRALSESEDLSKKNNLSRKQKENIMITQARVYSFMGIGFRNIGDLKNAGQEWEKSLQAYQKANYGPGIAEAKNNLGLYYLNKGDLKRAEEELTSCLKLRETLGNETEIALSNNNLGLLFSEKGDYFLALKFYTASVKLYEKLNNDPELANSLSGIAEVWEEVGNLNRSILMSEKSLRIRERINDKTGIANSLGQLAGIYHKHGDKEKAKEYFARSLKLLIETKNIEGLAFTYNNIATTLRFDRDFDGAIENFVKSLDLFQKMGAKNYVARCLSNIGNVYGDKKNYAAALNYYEQSVEIHKELSSVRGLCITYNNMADIYFNLNSFKKAKFYVDSAYRMAIRIGQPENIKNVSLVYASVDSATGNFSGAFYRLKEYYTNREKILNNENQKASMKSELKYDFEKKSVADSLRTAGEKQVINAQLKEEKTKSYALFGGLGLVLIFSGIMVNRFRITRKQKKIIELKEQETQKQNVIISHQKHLVEEKHKEITDSINYAERIQRSFLATKEILDNNLNEYFVLFKPKDIVSGDFYWAGKLNNGNFALVTADSTGHGVPGAIMSLLNITSIEKAIENKIEPSDILNSTRQTIIERLKKDGSPEGGKDGMDASLVVYDLPNRKVIISAANNPVWIVRGGSVTDIKADKMPLGKHDKQDVPFTQKEIDIEKGDIIYTLTDGFPDQFGGEKGKKYMSKNLREFLLQHSQLPMAEQKILLEIEFKRWVADLEQVDDVTVIGVRI
jgi:serine phosphatase RsbU (regulator of sigma subunit)